MDNQKRLFSRAGYYALSFLGSIYIFTIALVICLTVFAPGLLNISVLNAVLGVLQYPVALPFCILVLKGLPKQNLTKRHFSFYDLFGCFCVCALLSQVGYIIGAYCADGITSILGTSVSDTMNEQVNSQGVIENFLILVLAAPIFEELTFRKILLDKIAAESKNTAVFLSAMLFGLIHCNVYQFFYAFFIGSILGVIYIKSGRIRYSILLHSAFNLFFGFVPSAINTEWQIGKILMTLVVIAQYAVMFYGIVYLYKSIKVHKTFLKAFFSEINASFSSAMLNSGVIIAVIITTFLYISGLYL